jgi:hypothetical protein
MQCIVVGNVLHVESLDGLECIFVLPDTADGNPETVVKTRVCNSDIGAIALQSYTVIRIVYGPVVELDIGRADSVSAVSVCCVR